MPRSRREPPASFSDNWPDRACSDLAAEKVRLFVLRLRAAMGGASLRKTVAEVDLDYSILSDYLSGKTWPDSRAVALLEVALDQALWPPHVSREFATHEEPGQGVEG